MRAARDVQAGHPLHEGAHLFSHRRVGLRQAQQLTGCGQPLRLGRRCQQPIVAYPLEAGGHHVLHQPADELGARQAGHPAARLGRALRLAAARRWPAAVHPGSEAHLIAADAQQSLVADGGAVGVAAQVVQHRRRPGQRRLGVDHPRLPRSAWTRCARWAGSVWGSSRSALVPCACSSASMNLPLNTCDSARTGNMKVGLRHGGCQRGWPWSVVRQRAAGHQGVHMQVALQVLGPSVQHQREGADAAQPLEVGRKLRQRGSDGVQQSVVNQARLGSGQRIRLVGQGEHQPRSRAPQRSRSACAGRSSMSPHRAPPAACSARPNSPNPSASRKPTPWCHKATPATPKYCINCQAPSAAPSSPARSPHHRPAARPRPNRH